MNEWAQELGDELSASQIERTDDCLPLIPSRNQLRATTQACGLPPLGQLSLRILSVTGVRPQELSQIEIDNGQLQIKQGRPLGADSETVRQLSQLDQPLQIEPQQLQDWLYLGASQSGLKARFDGCQRQLRPTVYRHAYARDCLQQGIDLYALKLLLGHSEIKTTQRYIPTALADCQRAYRQSHPLMLPAPASTTVTRGGGPQANLSVAEVLALIASPTKARDRLMLRLLYATGLRASELLELRASDIDLDQQRLFVRGGKGGQDRYAILDPQSLELLWQYAEKPARRSLSTAEREPIDNIMPAERLFATTREQLFIIVKRAAKATGILQGYQEAGYSLSPHSFRHACASHCYNNGMPPGLVGKLLGHQDLRNTLIYCNCPQQRWLSELLKHQTETH